MTGTGAEAGTWPGSGDGAHRPAAAAAPGAVPAARCQHLSVNTI